MGGYDVTEQLFMDARGVPLTRFSEQDKRDFEVLRAALTQAGWKPTDPNTSALTALVAFMWARCTGRADVLIAIKEAIEGPADGAQPAVSRHSGGVLGQIKAVIAGEFAELGARLNALVEETTAALERTHEAARVGAEEQVELVPGTDRPQALSVEEIAAAVVDAMDRRAQSLVDERPAVSGWVADLPSEPPTPVQPTVPPQGAVPPAQPLDHDALATATADRVIQQLKPHVGVRLDLAAAKESLRDSFQLVWIWLALTVVLAAGGFGVWVGYRWAAGRDVNEMAVLNQRLLDEQRANTTLARICVPASGTGFARGPRGGEP